MPIPSDADLGALAEQLGAHLAASHHRLATAESCTGGWIGKTVTDIAGSSSWFECGMTAYSYEAKQALLNVRPVRQWVLSFPYPSRFLLASRPEIIGPVLGIVHRVIAGWLADHPGIDRCQRTVRGSDADPALRQAAQLEHPLLHADARRRLRAGGRPA